ncbi:Rho GTPase activation protein (RhoGAP) with PH domain [Zea mays]|uniref:Rho GTPase activation protein (RhoGAP) with PH domain n=1 Tax=Zea mays TaxID=4577 RepID=A0A1D6HC23_MAIZE|nr:Rho GTPase activation protein (RhoGAP) with PH domain [Zea mays]
MPETLSSSTPEWEKPNSSSGMMLHESARIAVSRISTAAGGTSTIAATRKMRAVREGPRKTDLRGQLNKQVQLSSTSLCESCNNKRSINADKLVEGEQNAALSPQIASVEAPPIVGSYSVPNMFWATNQMVQKMLYSKGEIAKDGQDGSLTSRWNFAQRPHSNSPVVSRVQGSDAYSSTKTEESGGAPSSALAKLTYVSFK